MALHSLTSESLRGTIATSLATDGDDTLCVIDLAPRTLGVHSSTHPHAMLRGTVTYTLIGGLCSALEHSVHVSTGQDLSTRQLIDLTESLKPYAQEMLADIEPVSITPQIDIEPIATILPMQRRAYA